MTVQPVKDGPESPGHQFSKGDAEVTAPGFNSKGDPNDSDTDNDDKGSSYKHVQV